MNPLKSSIQKIAKTKSELHIKINFRMLLITNRGKGSEIPRPFKTKKLTINLIQKPI
jgi:endonuclease IV